MSRDEARSSRERGGATVAFSALPLRCGGTYAPRMAAFRRGKALWRLIVQAGAMAIDRPAGTSYRSELEEAEGKQVQLQSPSTINLILAGGFSAASEPTVRLSFNARRPPCEWPASVVIRCRCETQRGPSQVLVQAVQACNSSVTPLQRGVAVTYQHRPTIQLRPTPSWRKLPCSRLCSRRGVVGLTHDPHGPQPARLPGSATS